MGGTVGNALMADQRTREFSVYHTCVGTTDCMHPLKKNNSELFAVSAGERSKEPGAADNSQGRKVNVLVGGGWAQVPSCKLEKFCMEGEACVAHRSRVVWVDRGRGHLLGQGSGAGAQHCCLGQLGNLSSSPLVPPPHPCYRR